MTSLESPNVSDSGRQRSGDVMCSAKGCRSAADWVIEWRNPRIHGLERRKAWSACEGHRDHLADFLRARSFLLDVTPLQP